MNIYSEVMSIYGITFLVSMFVALLIWVLAKLIDALPDKSFSIVGLIKNLRQNVISGKVERKQVLKEFRETQLEASKNLNNLRHERA